jgi:predicted transcriptional regulator
MGGRQTKRSCSFCQDADRDQLEMNIAQGIADMRTLDRDKGWRTNTAERHMRNHAGENLEGSNYRCVVCTDDQRSMYEVAYFDEGMTSQNIAEELNCSEATVYKHMKEHFQPIVKQSASAIVSIKVGQEADILRHNTERLNEKLSRYMDEVSIHDDGAVSDMVKLSKEIRESIKDLTSFQKVWVEPEEKMVANTINILKVEMAKESPDTWKRVKEALLTQEGDEIDISGLLEQEDES